MNMEIIKKHKFPLVVAIALPAAVLFFFSRMYQKDVRELADFSASYEKYVEAIDLERNADEALFELQTKASARISSLIKNDAGLMAAALEIADLSRKELDALKAYKRAVASKDVQSDKLAKESVDLRNKRQTAYARFKELAGLRD